MGNFFNKAKHFFNSFSIILGFIKVSLEAKFELHLHLPDIKVKINNYYNEHLQLESQRCTDTSEYTSTTIKNEPDILFNIIISFIITLASLTFLNNLIYQRFPLLTKISIIILLIIISISSIFIFALSTKSKMRKTLSFAFLNITIVHMISFISQVHFSFYRFLEMVKQAKIEIKNNLTIGVENLQSFNSIIFVQIFLVSVIIGFILCYFCRFGLLFKNSSIMKKIYSYSALIIFSYYLIYYFNYLIILFNKISVIISSLFNNSF